MKVDGNLKNYSAEEFANYLNDNDLFHGQDLRFVSCSVDAGDNSFAQQLSKILGIKVKAPDMDAFYAPEEGVVFIGSPYQNVDNWRVFDNGDEV